MIASPREAVCPVGAVAPDPLGIPTASGCGIARFRAGLLDRHQQDARRS